MNYTYTLKRSKRKTMSLSVKPDCSIVVHAPLTTSNERIENFINTHSAWIENQLQRMRQLNEKKQSFTLDYSSRVYFFGCRLPIEKATVRKAKLKSDRILMPCNLTDEQIRQQLITLYKETAHSYIGNQLPAFAKMVGVTPTKLRISSAKTNWGSCTADRVNFSWHLMMAEKEVIDYVIIHELCHIHHHNHSDKFWAEVSKHCPNWKKLRARLKFYSEIVRVENW